MTERPTIKDRLNLGSYCGSKKTETLLNNINRFNFKRYFGELGLLNRNTAGQYVEFMDTVLCIREIEKYYEERLNSLRKNLNSTIDFTEISSETFDQNEIEKLISRKHEEMLKEMRKYLFSICVMFITTISYLFVQ